MNHHREILSDPAGVAHRAAELILQAAVACPAHEPFSLALAGGSTPRLLYQLMADDNDYRSRMPWEKIYWFWGDERHVPPGHPDSNYRMAFETLLAHVPAPPEHIHRIRAELSDADVVALDYEDELRKVVPSRNVADKTPALDIILLGMGADGHTASIFPQSAVVAEQHRIVMAYRVEKLATCRITLTPPMIAAARNVVVLVTGADKAAMLEKVLNGPQDPLSLPIQLVLNRRMPTTWLLDAAAASLLA